MDKHLINLTLNLCPSVNLINCEQPVDHSNWLDKPSLYLVLVNQFAVKEDMECIFILCNTEWLSFG